ncbi:tetratricopeptide repeat protein, partial [bacterium]|nr:tetratricopeptide repeat protein [bacterium]
MIRVSAYLALQQFEQAEQAIAELEKIPGGSEKRWQALYQLAESAYAGSAWERAERLYRQIVDAEAPPEWTIKAMSGLGWTLFEAGDFAGAAAAFDKLQQSFPESRQAAADAGYMRGMAELRAERLEQAAGIFMETADKFQADESAEQGDEINYIAYRAAREAARTYRSLENTNKAADAYRVAYQQLSKQPESRQTNLDKLLDEWGLLHYEAGQYDEADAVFRILVEKCPKSDRSDDALLSLAESEYIAGNTVQARTMFEELLALPTADNYVQRRARYQLVLIAAEQKDLAAVQKFAQSYLSETDLADVPLAERGEVESQLVQFHLESGQLEQAKDLIAELLEKAEALEDDVPEWLPGLYVQAAEIARREKNYDRVRELQQTVQQKFSETEARDQIDVLVGRSY